MKTYRIGICGYGNLGRGVVSAITRGRSASHPTAQTAASANSAARRTSHFFPFLFAISRLPWPIFNTPS